MDVSTCARFAIAVRWPLAVLYWPAIQWLAFGIKRSFIDIRRCDGRNIAVVASDAAAQIE